MLKPPVIVDAYNEIGYDAMNVGDRDLAGGLEFLEDLEKKAKFPFLSANLTDAAGKPLFTPSIVREVGGYEIGIFGLMTKTFDPARHGMPELRVGDPVEAAKRVVADLAKKSDMIVALCDLTPPEVEAVIEAAPQIRIVIGGHTGTFMNEPEQQGETFIVQAGSRGKYLGVIDLTIADDTFVFTNPNRSEELKREKGRLEKRIEFYAKKAKRDGVDDPFVYYAKNERIRTILDRAKARLAEIERELKAEVPKTGNIFAYQMKPIAKKIADNARIRERIDRYDEAVRKLQLAAGKNHPATPSTRKAPIRPLRLPGKVPLPKKGIPPIAHRPKGTLPGKPAPAGGETKPGGGTPMPPPPPQGE
ncbi:MAG: hypothetical protein D6812_08480, partial [Deltaproteobacteria bacterium]